MTRLPNKRLFIGSLPYRFTEGELLTLFVPFGRITALRIMHNKWGKSRGLGFVEFDTLESAVAAKGKMHNFQIEDRTIIVDFSEPDPFLTPEGKARHDEAESRRPHRRPVVTSTPGSRPSEPEKPRFGTFTTLPSREHLRPTLFKQRFHGAKVGAKFAARTKKKK